jgi:LysR family transcriptional regulator, regulator of peptidoglycan recycling
LNAWRLAKGDREPPVRVDGPLVFNSIDLILDATLDGLGLAYLPSDQVDKLVKSGKLRGVLSKWTRPMAH